MSHTTTAHDWAMDREIVITRVFDAPRELVFEAWTNPAHLPRWFGPSGFTVTTEELDVRVGGRWRFMFEGPDGTRYDNRMVFLEITPPERLVFDHGTDQDEDPGRFRTTITFDAQSNGKTVLTLRQLHPTKAQRDQKIGFGAVEYGFQMLDKLAAHLRGDVSVHADPLSTTFAALADPTRRAILARLAEGSATVKELSAPFSMSAPAISKHLRVLERAGLIHQGREAQWRPCTLTPEPLEAVANWTDTYRRFWEGSFDRLGDYLDELQGRAPGPTQAAPPPPTRPSRKPRK